MPRLTSAILAVVSGLVLLECAAPAPRPTPRSRVFGVERGQASYYGGEFHGRRTANGERFDQEAMTAAHPDLPFGTLVRVTHLRNGRSVTVRVNDRGPFVRGRILDLSRGAARRLDALREGVFDVKIEVIKLGDGRRRP